MFIENNGFTMLFAVIVIVLTIVLPIGIVLFFIVPMIKGLRQNSILLKTGTPAQAKILKLWDTGATLNDNPQVGMLLEVRAAEGPIFQAETKCVVSRLKIPLVQVGSTVEVKFDPHDISKVALIL